MSENNINEINNIEELSNVQTLGGTSFYCYNGQRSAAKTAGNFTFNATSDANVVQIRVEFNAGDQSSYYMTYNLNGESNNFTFTPENNIKSFNGSVTNFNCQLNVPIGEGDGNTFCSIGVYKI